MNYIPNSKPFYNLGGRKNSGQEQKNLDTPPRVIDVNKEKLEQGILIS